MLTFLKNFVKSTEVLHYIDFTKNFQTSNSQCGKVIQNAHTADPQKVYFKVVTVHNETHSFQKIYYFPDWNSPKQTLLVFWALKYRAVKLTNYWDFSSSKLANFQNAIKWSIFYIFGFWTSATEKKSKFLQSNPILKITCRLVSDLFNFLRPFLAKCQIFKSLGKIRLA